MIEVDQMPEGNGRRGAVSKFAACEIGKTYLFSEGDDFKKVGSFAVSAYQWAKTNGRKAIVRRRGNQVYVKFLTKGTNGQATG